MSRSLNCTPTTATNSKMNSRPKFFRRKMLSVSDNSNLDISAKNFKGIVFFKKIFYFLDNLLFFIRFFCKIKI